MDFQFGFLIFDLFFFARWNPSLIYHVDTFKLALMRSHTRRMGAERPRLPRSASSHAHPRAPEGFYDNSRAGIYFFEPCFDPETFLNIFYMPLVHLVAFAQCRRDSAERNARFRGALAVPTRLHSPGIIDITLYSLFLSASYAERSTNRPARQGACRKMSQRP